MRRCRHQWETLSLRFSGQIHFENFSGRGVGYLLEQAMFGRTTIRQRCTLCGEEQIITGLGDAT